MCRRLLFLIVMFLAFGLAAVSSAQAATIVWVSFHGADDAPSDGASGAGFTEAPDKGYTDLLTANGYDVTRYITTATPDPAFLNGADLVIISRSAASNHYQNASATAWNTISAPMIILNGYTLRYNRMGYTTGNTIPDITGNITLTVNDPTHPIFAGIPLTDGTMINPYAGLATYPTDGTTAAGISINTDPVNNGTVLATISAAGNGPVGGMVIAEWQAGATLTHAGGAGTDTLAGHRLVFLTGSRESGGKNSQTAGMCDLYVDGAQMFLNAVGYMLSPPAPSHRAANPSPANGATDVPTDAVLSWTQGTGAISHHIYFGTNQADVAAGTPSTDMGTQIGTSYDPPGTLSYGTTYYWRIDEFDGATTYTGNIWRFTTQGQGAGNILFEYFWGTNETLETLFNLPTFPDSPDRSELRTSFEGPINWRDNYGTHVRGYLYPPQTGNYTFWIASDDQSQLWLSTDEDPAHAVQIASVPGWTPSRDFDRTPEQRSSEIALEAGRIYYIEALHSEGGGDDNLAVAWQGPTIPTRAIISGTFLSPWITFKAANPSPGNGATDVPTDIALNWTPGSGAISHHIYFGTNQADVVSGTGGTDKGTQIETTYTPEVLAYGTTYYWRIHEFDGATTYTGNIWSFTTTAISIPTNTSVGTWDPVTRTYTLTQDVTGSIRIDQDNLTLDGAGHRVVGPGSGDGVALFARTGVTVKNLNIQSFGNGIYIGNSSGNTLTGNTTNLNGRGIALDYSENNTLEGNNSESNTGPGINLWHSSGNNLTGNTNNSNGVGISLDNSTGNTLTGNVCESNAWCGIAIHDSSNGNTLNNNTCNSSTDYDGIGLYNSTGNTLTGNICESNKRAGIWLENSTGNTITTNTCSSNDGAGINLWGSSNNNNLIGNTNNSNNVGIDLHACDNNTLEGNNSELNTWAGINLYYSNGSTLTGNTNNSHNVGICLDYSIGNNLTDNTCNSSSWAGIRLYYSEKNNLTGNTNSLNGEGINLQNSTGNTLTDNTCSLNNGNGIAIWESSNNTLTGNTCNSNNDNGISLYHSQDHNLTDNIAELNTWSGINLDNSSGNTLTGNRVNLEFAGISLGESNNNTLSHNTCSSSTWAGIQLNNSNVNTIYNNNFISNHVQAHVDGGSGNVFNLDAPIGGNFWSDWTTPDGNHDRIVDSPYVFSGGQDNLPWTCQDGWLLLAIGIDIYPNQTPNRVYLSKNYTISVVVFGSASFNVTTLNSSTVRFGRTGAEAAPVRAPTIRDMNADGLPDAMYGFLTFKCGFKLGDTEGILTGSTTSGVLIEGRDSVLVSP
jgi:parallel beta-helix repeat protein